MLLKAHLCEQWLHKSLLSYKKHRERVAFYLSLLKLCITVYFIFSESFIIFQISFGYSCCEIFPNFSLLKMATKHVAPRGLNGLKSYFQNLADTSLRFFDLVDFQKRVSMPNPHPITEKLKKSGLVEDSVFLFVVQAPKLIYECIAHYNLKTKQIMLQNDNMLLSIDQEAIVSCLCIPQKEEVSNLSFSIAMTKNFDKKMVWRKEILKSWFQKPRGAKGNLSKTLFGSDLKLEIVNILVLLHRLRGEEDALNFVESFFLVKVICIDEQYVDWMQLVREFISSALQSMKIFNSFHMSSLLIYMLASLQIWPGLPYIQNYTEDVKVYDFYPCLQLHNSYSEYVNVNDALTMRICRELQGCPERRFSPKAIAAINQFGCSFIQY